MRPYLLLPALLAACADPGPDLETELQARRAALGLPKEPLPLKAAMQEMQRRAFEPLLGRVGSRRLPPPEVLDAALRMENLLARAEPAGAEGRAHDPAAFDALLADARDRAFALARAVASGNEGTPEAYGLLATCVNCHRRFRRSR